MSRVETAPPKGSARGPHDGPPRTRLVDEHRRLRQWWPVIATASFIFGVAAVALLFAFIIIGGRDHLVGRWTTESAQVFTVRTAGDQYELRVADGDWVPARGHAGTLFARLPAQSMSLLTGGEVTSDTEIEVGLGDDGEMRLARAAAFGQAPQPLSAVSKVRSAADWAAITVVVVAVIGLTATIVVGKKARIGAGDSVAPALAVAAGLALILGVLGIALAVVAAVLMLGVAWYMIVTRWLLSAVPDMGAGARALFTRRGRDEFRAAIERQDEQSDRGDALQRVADSLLDEYGSSEGPGGGP